MPISNDDRTAIQELYARNVWALDTGDVDGYTACYTANGALDFAAKHEGRAAIKKFAEDFRKGDPWLLGSHHLVHQFVIEGDGDRANVKAYVERIHRLPGRGRNNCNVVWAGHYNDTVVKTAGKWLFEKQIGRAWEGVVQDKVAKARA